MVEWDKVPYMGKTGAEMLNKCRVSREAQLRGKSPLELYDELIWVSARTGLAAEIEDVAKRSIEKELTKLGAGKSQIDSAKKRIASEIGKALADGMETKYSADERQSLMNALRIAKYHVEVKRGGKETDAYLRNLDELSAMQMDRVVAATLLNSVPKFVDAMETNADECPALECWVIFDQLFKSVDLGRMDAEHLWWALMRLIGYYHPEGPGKPGPTGGRIP